MIYETGLPMERYDQLVIDEYEAKLADEKAIRQAQWRPLHQAMMVYKWLLGYGKPRLRCTRTIQHNEEAVKIWDRIQKEVCQKYNLEKLIEADPCKLIEMNQYAIELIKEAVL